MIATVYHNPACSKSRALLALLDERGIAPHLVDYLLTPPPADELARLIALLGDEARDLLRRDDPLYATLAFAGREPDTAQIISALKQHPALMQRPVFAYGQRAVIARPPERALALL